MPKAEQKAQLLAIAAGAEKAERADRELDLAIHTWRRPNEVAYMDGRYAKGAAELMSHGGEAWEKRKDALYRSCYNPPAYTAYVDAALMLLGDKAAIIHTSGQVAVYRDEAAIDANLAPIVEVTAATPALAIVAAACRALAEEIE